MTVLKELDIQALIDNSFNDLDGPALAVNEGCRAIIVGNRFKNTEVINKNTPTHRYFFLACIFENCTGMPNEDQMKWCRVK